MNDEGDFFLLASGRTQAEEKLVDESHLRNVLRKIPSLIEMSAIFEPVVHVATNNPGLEGYVPIDLSNITVSTYTDPPRVVVCVHSCQQFATQPVLDYIKQAFACELIRSVVVREGWFK
jgi:S-adenosylmethionine/arginine decarboxylase-like enzyme